VQVVNTNTLTPTVGGEIVKVAPNNAGQYVALDTNDAFTVTVGSGSYTFTVGGSSNPAGLSYNTSTQAWSLVVPAGVITVDGVYNVGVSVNAVGYAQPKVDVSVGELTIKRTAPVVSINTLAGDGLLNIAESGGSLTLSGSVLDAVPGGALNTAVGRTVTVSLNGQSYTATVQPNGSWTATVPAADVAALSDATETVQVAFDSLYGNSGSQSRDLELDLSAPVFTSSSTAAVSAVAGARTAVGLPVMPAPSARCPGPGAWTGAQTRWSTPWARVK
jgi:hypothetical protein